MGAGQFKAVNCCTSIKSIHVIRKKTPQAAEPSGADSENGPSTTPLNYTTVVLTQKDFKENTFKEFSKFRPGITTVRFEIPSDGRWIPTDNEVEQLKTLPDLTSIDLSGCHEITRRGVEYLSFEPEKIKVLILRDCVKITDTFFDDIVHFPHLKHLDVRGCFRISDIAVKALTTLKLRYLDISVLATDVGILSSESHSTITDASIEALSRMTHLETLQMEGTSITDDGFIRLVTLRNLTSLNIAATHVTENGLRILKHFPKLQTLNIAACTFSDVHCAQKITSLTKLTSLNVSKAPGVTNAFLQCLSNLSNLEHLILSGCHQLTTQSLDSVNTLTQLTTLNANCCIGIKGNGISRLSALSKLRHLHLRDIVDIQYDDLLLFKTLQELEISERSVDEASLMKLTKLEGLTHLIVHVHDLSHPLCTNIAGVNVTLLRNTTNENLMD